MSTPDLQAAKHVIGVGGPGLIHLNHFGALIREAFFGEVPFLVGSAARSKTWRDVDVRLMLPDDVFDEMFGASKPGWMNPMFSLMTAAISALGAQYTGLPIDFQFQSQGHANQHYGGETRIPLGLWHADWRAT
jgi:hypothetical protein